MTKTFIKICTVALLLASPAYAVDIQCTTAESDLICGSGEILRGINNDGSKICENLKDAGYLDVTGVCGSVHYTCTAGAVNDRYYDDTSAAYLWRCDGLYGGANSGECSENKPQPTGTDAQCGNYGGACDVGTSSGATSETINSTTYIRWTCYSDDGGNDASCVQECETGLGCTPPYQE